MSIFAISISLFFQFCLNKWRKEDSNRYEKKLIHNGERSCIIMLTFNCYFNND